MTEQEQQDMQLRRQFRESAKPAERSLVPTICMYESEAIEFAKTYAKSEVAKAVAAKDAEIAELTKTLDECEQDALDSARIAGDLTVANDDYHRKLKRLRDALVWLKENRSPDRAMIEIFIDKVLSTETVTEEKDENGLLPCPLCKEPLLLFKIPSKDGSIIWHKITHGPNSECSISMTGNSVEDLQRQWNRNRV